MNIKGSLIFQLFHVNGDKKMVLLQKDCKDCKDCYNINKDQMLVKMEEWSGKEKVMKQERKLREKRKQRRYS
jgi:hypothetical protein